MWLGGPRSRGRSACSRTSTAAVSTYAIRAKTRDLLDSTCTAGIRAEIVHLRSSVRVANVHSPQVTQTHIQSSAAQSP